MRTLVIGDIHGAYKALKQVLERASITSNDFLVFLGDYADGWSQTPQVIDYLMKLKETHNCLFIRGNHDDLCQTFLNGEQMGEMWYFHGGKATEKAYLKVNEATKRQHKEFLQELKNYHLDTQNRLFLHAGFTNLRGVEHEYFPKMYYWDRTLWELAISQPPNADRNSIFYPKRLNLYKEIFIGHTPTTRFHCTKPMHASGVWNVDTGAAFLGCITVLDIDTKHFWQSDPVYKLYPNEKGRNEL